MNQIFFTAVVEDRADPLLLGRIRVRVHGLHTDDKNLLPTENLPWAVPLSSINSAGIGGVGKSPTGILEGSTVIVSFADGESKQIPIVFGVLYGIGDIRSNDDFAGKSELPILATKELEDEEIASSEESEVYAGLRASFTSPAIAYNAQYPFNNVTSTLSGHVFELDDTPEFERVRLRHKSGTQVEMQPNGNYVERIKRNSFELTVGDKYISVQGSCAITAEGDIRILCKSNAELVTEGNLACRVKGNFGALADGNIVLNSKGDTFINADGNLVLRGATIQENSPGFGLPNDLFPQLEITAIDEAFQEFDEPETDPGVTQEEFDRLKERSGVTDFEGEAGAVDNTPPDENVTPQEEINSPCDLEGTSPETRLAGNWFISDLTTKSVFPHRLRAQRGLTERQIACNLLYLVNNILIPLEREYGRKNIQINSGFRQGNGRSFHELGLACDLVFRNARNQSDYDEIYRWIRDNLKFRTLIKEKANNFWLHIDVEQGNDRKLLLTRTLPGVYRPGLVTIV